MKIRTLRIENYRSLRNINIEVSDLTAFVGRNNTGKSNILAALNLFFNPTTRYLDETAFYNHNTDSTIRIVARFEDLSGLDRERFAPWIDEDSLTVGYEISAADEGSFDLSIVAIVSVPDVPWLQDSEISGANIDEWWTDRDQLVVNGLDFGAALGTARPRVGDWQEAARQFREEHRDDLPWVERKITNPKGAKNVLKGSLPEFIYVPAVRDVTEETKVTKTSPFGQLIHSILDQIPADQKEVIASDIARIADRLNRGGDLERVQEIEAVEARLNELMSDLMECDVEIEMAMPQLDEVLGEAQIFADDGVRTPIELKGHGMQRAMILTILRHYAEISSERKAGERATERSAIVAVEEPELYLHPQSQRTLMAVFRDIASGSDQVFCTTHSSLFVDIGYFDEICRLKRKERDGRLKSVSTQLTMEMMKEDLRQRRGISPTARGVRSQYSNVFNPLVNEGFFADKVLIVEGPSELYIIRHIATALEYDLDRENVAVVHGDGKGQMDRLVRVFSGFRIPTFVWFDGDKDSDDVANRTKTIELLEMLGDPIEHIEQLSTAVHDHYAVLERDLEDMLEDSVPDYEELVGRATEELGPCGKPLKAQFIGQALASRIQGEEGVAACPEPLREIVDALRRLDQVTEILHPAADKLRPT